MSQSELNENKYLAFIDRSMARREWNAGESAKHRAAEERHCEMLSMLDRIATALEAGNKLTTDTLERT